MLKPAVMMLAACCLLGGCASFNRVTLSHQRHTTIGQELTDLAKARDTGLLSEQEYGDAKKQILAWAKPGDASVGLTGAEAKP